MWIRIANKFAKFHAKRLNRSENIPKRLGGYFFVTPCTAKHTSYHQTFSPSGSHTILVFRTKPGNIATANP